MIWNNALGSLVLLLLCHPVAWASGTAIQLGRQNTTALVALIDKLPDPSGHPGHWQLSFAPIPPSPAYSELLINSFSATLQHDQRLTSLLLRLQANQFRQHQYLLLQHFTIHPSNIDPFSPALRLS